MRIELEQLDARRLGLLSGQVFALGRGEEVCLGAGEFGGEGRQLAALGRHAFGRFMGTALRLVSPRLGVVGLQVHRVVSLASRVERGVRQQVRQILRLRSDRPERRPQLDLGLAQRRPDVLMAEREFGLQPAAGLVELEYIEVARLSVPERELA